MDWIEKLAAEIGGQARFLDVTDSGSVEEFASWTESLGGASVLVNNAGGAKGLEPVAEMVEENWRWMFETNVLSIGLMTRAPAPDPALRQRARRDHRLGGGGRDLPRRLGLQRGQVRRPCHQGEPALGAPRGGRADHGDPPWGGRNRVWAGALGGDEERAETPYKGITPLTAEDVAECVRWAVSLPPHVNVDRIDVKPVRQAGVARFVREAKVPEREDGGDRGSTRTRVDKRNYRTQQART